MTGRAAENDTAKSYDLFCPVARTLDLVGDRWTLLVLRDVSLFGPRRFSELRENLEGVPPTLLSSRLKRLVADGLLERCGSGRHVTYAFTERGREVRPILRAMRDFGASLMPRGWESKVPPQVFRG
ncbi:MAG: winged helix-turn-helix transcriptional regulator [Ilumatobacteraceae bacterium]